MNNSFDKIYNPSKDYILILLGTLLYGFSFNGFILSNQIVTGGLSGVCALIFFATKGFIPVSLSYFTINIVLLLIALKVLGFKFLIKTIFGVFSLSGSLWLFEQLLHGQPILHNQPFMSIVIGAFLCGIGLGLVFSAGGSTGGTDILAAIVNKYKNVSMGTALMMFDFVIISSSYMLFQNVDKIVFGFVEMVVGNYTVDMILNSNRRSVQFLIFSQKYDEIAQHIINDLGRGCTIIDGTGGYSQKPVKVIILLVKKSESIAIFRMVKQIDHQAFISQSLVQGVYGEGFDKIKT
jgi:uncharacterized membrane-anchored protein YitT (DUF2179 family)